MTKDQVEVWNLFANLIVRLFIVLISFTLFIFIIYHIIHNKDNTIKWTLGCADGGLGVTIGRIVKHYFPVLKIINQSKMEESTSIGNPNI